MISKSTPDTTTSTLAATLARSVALPGLVATTLLLGACGGGSTSDPDGVVVDPAAAPDATEPVVDAAPEMPVTDAMPVEEPAVAAAEGMADEAGEGWTAMQSDWETSAGVVKDRWAELTEEDILGTGGDREQLVVLVQEKYGIARDQAEQEVNDWAAAL